MFAAWNIFLGEIHNKYKWSQQDFQRPHKHSSHAGSCQESLVWMTLNWWYDKLKSGKVFNVKNPFPERFPHTIWQSFTWLRTFTSKPWHFQSSYCVASSMKSSIKVDITFNTLCTVKRDSKRSCYCSLLCMFECKQTIIITTSILLTVRLCVSSPLITGFDDST